MSKSTMQQPDERTTKLVHRRKRRKGQYSLTSKSTPSLLPLDLILQILLRLPLKSVMRFRCVSKLWSSITTDLYFINSWETQSSTQPSHLMFFKKGENLFVFLFGQHHQNLNDPYSYSQHVDSYHMKYPKYCCFPSTQSVHGLICFRIATKPVIWNPTMRQFVTLPKPEKSWKGIVVFLGYDPIESKHKLVCMPCGKTCDECQVLTLGSTQKSWRTIKTNHKHFSIFRYYGQCINGIIYYQAYIDQMGLRKPAVMSFDVRFEKFGMIKLPEDKFCAMLLPYENRLACVNKTMINDVAGITLWTLEDAEKYIWSSKHFLAPHVHYDESLKIKFKLDGITHAGEFIYVPSTFLKSFYIFYFDPKENSFRRVEFRGIADEKFRLSNGLGDKRLNRLHTFPHHIQSLTSLLKQ